MRLAVSKGSLESRIEALAADRRRGGTALARLAVGILDEADPAERPALAERLAALRLSMPAIGTVARDAASRSRPVELLDEIEAEHQRVAEAAAAAISGADTVATISHSSLVERSLLFARPRLVQVCVDGASDEGHVLIARLKEAGIEASPAPGRAVADIGLCGCDAIFDDGGFVNRRGTSSLLADLGSRPLLIVGDRWRRVPGSTPPAWPEPELFEAVPPAPNVRLVY